MKFRWLITLAILFSGCAAPRARLTFPKQSLMTRNGWEWFDVNSDKRPDFATENTSGGRVDRIAYDDDQDGNPDRIYRLSNYQNERVPHLIVLLDSIPFEPVAKRYAAGEFGWFDAPQKVIGVFPTLTEISYTDFLHAPPLLGMIDKYYDHREGKMFNGLWHRFNSNEQPWERRLTYHAKFWEGGATYLKPRDWYAAELRRVRDAFDSSPDRVSIVYAISASGMMSRHGEAGLNEILEGVRQLSLQLIYERQGAIKISVMADHGHNLTKSVNVHLADILKDAGFHPTDELRKPDDIIVELDGLLTYAGLVTTQPQKAMAVVLARPEIEFAMTLEGDRVIVRDASGSAAIESRGGKVRYRSVDRDLLKYQPICDDLTAKGKMDADGFASDDDWFAATLDHEYPDAPRRIWDAFHGEVVNPPTIILTLKDGWCAGEPAFEKFITMQSTHGGLNQTNSATFIMTMTGRIDSPVRMKELLQKLEPGFVPRIQR